MTSDNRQKVGEVAANRRVFNVFGYTGGFSVYAGWGGQPGDNGGSQAAPALAAAQANWELNGAAPWPNTKLWRLMPLSFCSGGYSQSKDLGFAIVDLPSFAACAAVAKAIIAYQKLIAAAAASTAGKAAGGGFLFQPRSAFGHLFESARGGDVPGLPPGHRFNHGANRPITPTLLASAEFRYSVCADAS
ncbi:MAG: hypothetical protein U0401_19355 [Anaerolineae bacterium]